MNKLNLFICLALAAKESFAAAPITYKTPYQPCYTYDTGTKQYVPGTSSYGPNAFTPATSKKDAAGKTYHNAFDIELTYVKYYCDFVGKSEFVVDWVPNPLDAA